MPASRRLSPPAISGSLAALGLFLLGPDLAVPAAQAQFFWNAPAPSVRSRVNVTRARVPRRDAENLTRRGKPAEDPAAKVTTTGGPLMAVISLSSQRLTIYDSSGPILRSPISSGQSGHRTPTGVFSIIQKNRHHVSNIYSGAPMPFMQRITWSGIAMHAGNLPGYPASHGCIRLPFPVASKLFGMTKMGMRVVIGSHEPSATAFTHTALPEPLMVAATAADGQRADADAAAPVRVATVEGSDKSDVATRFLNTMQNAVLERTRSRTRLTEAIKANKDLLDASLRMSAEANAAAGALRVVQATAEALRMRLAGVTGEARQPLEAQLADAEKAIAPAIALDAEKNRAAYAAAKASREAEEAQAAAEEAIKVADRGVEPIAVFISRREGKVFVRQGMVPLFDAPVTFREPNRPLGTHVYQAMSADGATGRIGWMAVTAPESIGFASESLENRGPVRRGERSVGSVGAPSDARGALDRVEMAPEIKRRISERLWINGSVVISDHGISNETGKGTDFVVLTQ